MIFLFSLICIYNLYCGKDKNRKLFIKDNKIDVNLVEDIVIRVW